jgi:hypothetical protein
MQRIVGILLPYLLLAAVSAYSQTSDINWRIYAQIAGDRANGDRVDFDFDRIRVRAAAGGERFSGVVQLELAAEHWDRRQPGATVDVIFDAYADYRINERYSLRAGEFKTPLGLDFTLAPNVMEITKRGMDFGLVLNRATGVMLSGRNLGRGFGYDAGVFNLAGRSGATANVKSQEDDEYAFAARGHYGAQYWRVELAHGETGSAGGPGTADYRVSDFGWAFDRDQLVFKLEWIRGRGVRGDASRSERVYYVHGAYRLREDLELVMRHFDGHSQLSSAATDLTNTYVGVTWHALQETLLEGRFQLNYVFAGGDKAAYTGVRGYRDDALLAQFQFLFSR